MKQPFTSALFTDSERYENRKFGPKALELPTFLLKRISGSQRAVLDEILKKYGKIYSLKQRPPQIFPSPPQETVRPSKVLGRKASKEPSWRLAPNRYTLKSPLLMAVSKQAGLKGPFQCFSVARDDSTVCGRNAPSKFAGSKQFIFNPPPGIGQTKSFSVRNPEFEKFPVQKVQRKCGSITQPGPTTYFEGIMGPRKFQDAAQQPLNDLNFYPGTSVPITFLSIHKSQLGQLDPGRYEPIDEFEIPGKGHKSVFKARLRAPKFVAKKKFKSDFVMETNKVDFGRRPHRPISFNPLSLFDRPINVRLTSLSDVGRRRKRATLKNVGFMSGTTRFGHEPFKNLLKDRPKSAPQPVKSLTVGKRPPLYSVTTDEGVGRIADRTGFSFAPMPDAKLIPEAIDYELLKAKRREIEI